MSDPKSFGEYAAQFAYSCTISRDGIGRFAKRVGSDPAITPEVRMRQSAENVAHMLQRYSETNDIFYLKGALSAMDDLEKALDELEAQK